MMGLGISKGFGYAGLCERRVSGGLFREAVPRWGNVEGVVPCGAVHRAEEHLGESPGAAPLTREPALNGADLLRIPLLGNSRPRSRTGAGARAGGEPGRGGLDRDLSNTVPASPVQGTRGQCHNEGHPIVAGGKGLRRSGGVHECASIVSRGNEGDAGTRALR